jgi:hypothetical protein
LETTVFQIKGNKSDWEKQILHAVANILRHRIYPLKIKGMCERKSCSQVKHGESTFYTCIKIQMRWAAVGHTCNPSYSGGRG